MNNNNHQSQPATAAVDSIHWDVEEGASRSFLHLIYSALSNCIIATSYCMPQIIFSRTS